MVKAGGFLLATLAVLAVSTSPLLMRVNTDELGRLKSAVPPVILQDYDGNGAPGAGEPAQPEDVPAAPAAPDPGEGASSGSMSA